MNEQILPIHFIGERIEVIFNQEQIRTKNPGCPDAFCWRSTEYTIIKIVKQWTDFSRKGNMQRNMSEVHHSRAEIKGSWGVGKIFFRIQVHTGQIFEIYFDRAPQNVMDRGGGWFLLQEFTSVSDKEEK
jgi:hypothetical protein